MPARCGELRFSYGNFQQSCAMSTVNYSVPEDVKQAFDQTFAGQNKSAVIAALMREAVEREARRSASRAAAEQILEARRSAPLRSAAQLRKARVQGRP